MPGYIVNFLSILVILVVDLVVADVFPIDPQQFDTNNKELSREQQFCNFNEDTRTYNATDLFLCLNEMAKDTLLQQNISQNKITDRAYQDTRQSYHSYPYAPNYLISPTNTASSNYFGNNMLTSLLSGKLPFPNLSDLFKFNTLNMSGLKFFNALSTISKYDDLKCVPRILCEVASGSMPGSLSYRQNNNFQDFGTKAIFGLLRALDISETSPILNFGKAALLGYTNRGSPHTCYEEYPRCPRNQDQLISYLNNHNGGFFRLFNANLNNYYRPQQSYYRPYYKSSEYRIANPKSEYSSPYLSLRPEADRTGTGKLSFINSDYYKNENSNQNFFSLNLRESESNRVVFPKDKRESQYESNYGVEYPNIYNNDLNVNNYYAYQEPVRKDRQFFPQEDFKQNYDSGPVKINLGLNYIESNRRPRTEVFNNKRNYVHFPYETSNKKTYSLIFPYDYGDY